jgi:ribosomal subunit interface protein
LRVQIAQRHCDVPDDVLQRTEDLVEKLSKYEPHVGSAEVVYSEERHIKHIEVILHIDGAAPIVARADEREFRSALDKVLDKVTRMLKKHRGRRTDHQGPTLSEVSTDLSEASTE